MNAEKSQDAKAKLEADAKAKAAKEAEAKEVAKKADAEKAEAEKEAAELDADAKEAEEKAEKAAEEAKKSGDKDKAEKAEELTDRAIQLRKAHKSATMNKRATKEYAKRQKEKDALKGTEDDPDKKQFVRIPTDYRDVEEGKVYEFKCHHGRVKFEGFLYEPEETFKTTATDEMIGLVKKGVLEIPALPRR